MAASPTAADSTPAEGKTDFAAVATSTASAVTSATGNAIPYNQGGSPHRSLNWSEKFEHLYIRFTYTPPNCRYDPSKPFQFSLGLNVLFAFATTFTVSNLYYTHPILNILADDFHVSYETSASVPTLAQAGYAIGLFFVCPLGDLFRRRRLVLWLVWFTATVWIGLCVTTSFAAFQALTFIISLTTVTPQLILPLVGDLAPPEKRATAMSLVVSGAMLGMLIARLISGIVTNFVSWRVVFWIGFGVQYLIVIMLYLFMPDYPATNPGRFNYFRILWSTVSIAYRSPLILQACLVAFFTSSVFTSFWTTLTFLLSSPPYDYSPLVIGLFALIGIASMFSGPIYSRYIIDNCTPLFSVILGLLTCMTGVVVGTYTGTFTIAGPVIQAFMVDLGLQATQIANRTSIFTVDPRARNRINTAYMVCTFFGQLMGTAAGNNLYAQHGWIGSGSGSVGFVGAALILCFLRGPMETGWVGWRGGWPIRRRDLPIHRAADDPEPATEGDNAIPTVASEKIEKDAATDERLIENESVEKWPQQ